MPFIATCPYCQASRFRAPSKKRGTFITCPKCRQDFLLLPGSSIAARPLEYRLPPFESEDVEQLVEEAEDSPSGGRQPPEGIALGGLTPPARETVPGPQTEPVASPPPAVRAPVPPPRHSPDYALRLALAALGLFGAAVIASQFPYGRFVAAPLAGIGAVLAGLTLLGLEQRRWVGWSGVGLNAFAVLLVVALPGWLGLSSSWRPADDPSAGPKPVTAAGRDGGLPVAADWVDARAAVWEHGDVRISITGVSISPRDPAAPPSARRKDLVLRVGLKLTNVGVARAIPFTGWAAAPDGGPRLTTAGGEQLVARVVAERADAATILPGKSADAVVAFAAPEKLTDDLRLELPATAFGGTEPVRFRVPRAMVR